MPKGHEDHRSQKKKPKFTLKERRQQKRDKRERERELNNPHTDVII